MSPIEQAAEHAALAHAQRRHWAIEKIVVGPVSKRPPEQHVVLVRLTPVGESAHVFEYRCDASGVGSLWPA